MAAPLDPDRPVRWGIQGAGAIARTVGHVIAASPGSVVQAVAARDLDRAQALGDELGARTAHGSYAALADDLEVDVVYVATTHGQHHPQVRALLEADKAVLVEKSFTVNAEQADDLVALARQRELLCMEAVWTRTLPAFRAAVDAAGTRIGRVVGLRTDLTRVIPYDPAHRLWDPATGGGALLDLGVYACHVAWAFLGAPDDVAVTGHLAPNGVDATVAMQWSYPDGVFAHVAASFEAVSAGPHTVLLGTEGWLALHGRTHEPDRVVTGRRDEDAEQVHVPADPSTGRPGYGAQVAEVERALRAGETESPLVPLDDTVGVLRVMDTARAALGVDYGELEGV